ncbi:hypothetical protein BC360_16540 [Ensifer sp. LC163]|nr:hypothetical protein BC360_16540 [Ensifer sp. LC163]
MDRLEWHHWSKDPADRAMSAVCQSHSRTAVRPRTVLEEDDPSSFVDAFDRFNCDRLRAPWASLVLLNPADCIRGDFSQFRDLPYAEL